MRTCTGTTQRNKLQFARPRKKKVEWRRILQRSVQSVPSSMTDEFADQGVLRRRTDSRIFCCLCGKTNVMKFKKLYRMDGRYYTVRGSLCAIETMDDAAFGKSPHICQVCYLKTCEKFSSDIRCDVCDGRSKSKVRYALTSRNGVICIGPHRSLIFSGPITTGRVCSSCYSRNKRAILRRHLNQPEPSFSIENDDGGTTASEDDDDDEDDNYGIGNGSENEEDAASLSPPPRKKRKRPEVRSNAMHEETAIPRQDPQVQVMAIVDALMSIEKAKTQTLSIKENVMAFMSHRASLQEAMAIVDQSDCNVAEFVAMQDCFVAMLDNQLQTIENDRLGCIAQLTQLTTLKSTSNEK